ncbi:hypothetical protein SDC9_207359 [bioreactor metagenome]|uniref:Transketolase N-terminal domain-containing protein n=1 Tax=bioreactor metagenome TaxID=1076179 RepID=A0A645J7K2_9ZZZZ
MLAAQLRLDNLVAIVDYNGLQSDGESSQIIDLGDLAAKFAAFGWNAVTVDGHDIPALHAALTAPSPDRPRALIARTVKGKGISFMENNNEWHHNRLTKASYDSAVEELSAPCR